MEPKICWPAQLEYENSDKRTVRQIYRVYSVFRTRSLTCIKLHYLSTSRDNTSVTVNDCLALRYFVNSKAMQKVDTIVCCSYILYASVFLTVHSIDCHTFHKMSNEDFGAGSSTNSDIDSRQHLSLLVQDAKSFILHIVKKEAPHKPELLDYLSDRWLADREVAAAGLQSNSIRADELPESLKNDRAYLLKAVRQNSDVWHTLPAPFDQDPEFVCVISKFREMLMLHDIFERFPALLSNREIWWRALETALDPELGTDENREIFRQLLENFAPDTIRNDKEIMTQSAIFIKHIFAYFGTTLRNDTDFFQSLYNKSESSTNTTTVTTKTEISSNSCSKSIADEKKRNDTDTSCHPLEPPTKKLETK